MTNVGLSICIKFDRGFREKYTVKWMNCLAYICGYGAYIKNVGSFSMIYIIQGIPVPILGQNIA